MSLLRATDLQNCKRSGGQRKWAERRVNINRELSGSLKGSPFPVRNSRKQNKAGLFKSEVNSNCLFPRPIHVFPISLPFAGRLLEMHYSDPSSELYDFHSGYKNNITRYNFCDILTITCALTSGRGSLSMQCLQTRDNMPSCALDRPVWCA